MRFKGRKRYERKSYPQRFERGARRKKCSFNIYRRHILMSGVIVFLLNHTRTLLITGGKGAYTNGVGFHEHRQDREDFHFK